MPGIVYDLPTPLSGRTSSSATTFTQSTIAVDYALGGFPFLSAINNERPYVRGLAPVRKQQFDNSKEPGEQSLEGWWLRSQSSFHAGTGLKFREPEDEVTPFRFWDSLGVNVWTAGQVTMLKGMTLKKSGSGTVLTEAAVDGSTDVYFHAASTTLSRETSGGTTAVTWGGANNIESLTTDGSNYYAADSVGVYRGTVAGGAGSLIWNTGTAAPVIKWVKQRLMAGIGASIYELVGSGPALPAAKFTHPNTSWRWTSFSEGGAAIYAAGYAGATSAIYRFTLDSGGAVPTLTQGVVTAQLPLGEVVHSIYAYIGTFMGVGTSKGFRVGIIDQSTGNLELGPLIIETTSPVKCITGRDRFMWCGATNSLSSASGLYRVDLGQVTTEGRFAYATDLQTGVSGTVDSVTTLGASARLVVGISGSGSYLENSSDLQSSGYLQTPNIRFSTLEPKLYKFLRIRGTSAFGSLGVSTIDSSGGTTSLITYGTTDTPGEDLALSHFDTAQEYIALKFTFTRDSVSTGNAPTLYGWQLKALPGIDRDEMFTLPLLCFDFEKDRNGVRWGYEGAALDRWQELRDGVRSGDVVRFQDLSRDETFLVIVEDIRFTQTNPPSPNQRGYGGIIQVQMRSVA